MKTLRQQTGFTMLETMLGLAVLVVVGGIVTAGMFQLMKTQNTIANRTDMHTSVRSATELLEQEIGQAGRLSLGASNASITLHAAVAASSAPVNFQLDTNTGASPAVYPGEILTVDVGTSQEVVTVSTGTTNSGTAAFNSPHAAGVPVSVLGAFATGVVPPAASALTDTNGQCVPSSVTISGTSYNYSGYTGPYAGDGTGSTCEVLKLYGDINGDGNMVYVEYTCSQGTTTAPGFLYRQQVPFAGPKNTLAPSMILLNNVLFNPNDANNSQVPCFRYQVRPLGGSWVVTDVAVTLTVQTQNVDPVTKQFQPETKALLNVSPRNVLEVFNTAKLVDPTRAQVMPPSVGSLL